MEKKKNTVMDIEHHVQIYERKLKFPSLTNEKLAEWAKITFDLNKSPDKSTISKIISKGKKGQLNTTAPAGRKRARKPKWPVSYGSLIQRFLY